MVLGSRRAAALRVRLHSEHRVPVMVAAKSSQLNAWLAADGAVREINGLPWSWTQRALVYGYLVAHVQTRSGQPGFNETLAAYLGVHPGQLRNAWYLVRDFNRAGGDWKVQIGRAIQAMESGDLLPQSAGQRLKREGFPAAGAPAPRPDMSVAEQVKAITALGNELEGLRLGIETLGPVHPDLTAEQRAALLVPLAKFRADFTRLTRALAPTTHTQEGSNA